MHSLKGKILISEPFMLDPHFKRSVVLICEHNEEGAYGFILNRPLEVISGSIIEMDAAFRDRFGLGGPVAADTLHYIHNLGELIDDSVEIIPGKLWSDGDFEALQSYANEQLILPENVLFFIGYSGWSEGQLEEELKIGSWIVSDIDSDTILQANYMDLWKDKLKNLGETFDVISEIPDSANYN